MSLFQKSTIKNVNANLLPWDSSAICSLNTHHVLYSNTFKKLIVLFTLFTFPDRLEAPWELSVDLVYLCILSACTHLVNKWISHQSLRILTFTLSSALYGSGRFLIFAVSHTLLCAPGILCILVFISLFELFAYLLVYNNRLGTPGGQNSPLVHQA